MVASRTIRRLASGSCAALAGLGVLLLAGGSVASRQPEAAVGGSVPVSAVTFEAIARAENRSSLRLEQLRRVREVRGTGAEWTGIRERLTIAPAADAQAPLGDAAGLLGNAPRFRLEFVGLEDGPAATSDEAPDDEAIRRELYRGYAGYLHLYAHFRIDDPARAARNYVIVDLGPSSRLGRPTHRVALLPLQLGRNPWILEVDAATSYPLFRAEYNAAGVLVSTLEVTRFEAVDPAALQGVEWWQPSRRVEDFDSLPAALTRLGENAEPCVPEPEDLPSGYELGLVRIVREDLRPESSLVLVYTDGIDEIFVVSTFGAPPPALAAASGAGGAHAILYYQDQNVAQFLFRADTVNTMVIGRAGQFALAGLAHDLLARAID